MLKEPNLLGLQIEDANYAIFYDEGDGEFGTHVGIGADVVGFIADILNEDGFPFFGSAANDPLAYADPHSFHFGGVPDLKAHAQVVGSFVQQQDGEDFVIEDGAYEVGRPMQQ